MTRHDLLKTLLVLTVCIPCAPLNAGTRDTRPAASPAPIAHFHPQGQPPSQATVALQRLARSTLPFEDQLDFAESKRGFVAAPAYTEINTTEGGSVWRFDRYAFLDTKQDFDSIHPSLQRQAVLNAQYGLYEVVPGKIWQVRGFDISNITFVRSDTGWIIFDPLVSKETAEAIRASISMPGMFTPCFREGRLLVDGGVINPVPVSLCRCLGANTVIAVNPNTDIRIQYEITREPILGGPPKKEPEEHEQEQEQGLRLRDLFFAGLTLYITERIHRGKSVTKGPSGAKSADSENKGLKDHLIDYLSHYINATMKQGKSLALGQITEDGSFREPSLFEVITASINLMGDRIARQRLAGDPPDVLILPAHVSHVGLITLELSRWR